MNAIPRIACLSAALIAGPVWAQATTGPSLGGELRASALRPQVNTLGPLALAHGLAADIASPPADQGLAEAELRSRWGPLSANALLSRSATRGAGSQGDARFNELHASGSLGGWQWSGGKKIVNWDVGYGFRPNDLVEQEVRRSLLTVTPEGRPLIQAEHFGADSAASLVWVNPQRQNRADSEQRGPEESALAARWYQRSGALDLYGFARAGQHTGASLGAAAAWVATDELELHASVRSLARFDGWQFQGVELGTSNAEGNALLNVANPWQLSTQGHARQALVGGQWTGQAQQSLMLEAWYDGTARSPAQWRDWQARNAGLAQFAQTPGLPAAAQRGASGNLAWQATPLSATNLHQLNLFARWAWQPEHWQLTLDALITPADQGRVLSAGAQWQGDAWRFNAAWRQYGGPAKALMRQLPSRETLLLAATWSF